MNQDEVKELIRVLGDRFERNPGRHPEVAWSDVRRRLESGPGAVKKSLLAMESTGGEPDVVALESGGGGGILFCDCSPETPSGRRSLCYDRAARDARKEHKPQGSAMEMAASMGVGLLDEAQYRVLQQLGEFDCKTSSWVLTPPDVRALGGALFCDRRYGRVFMYHNGASSYYAARGFRALLRV